jgi:hypothetical protein
VKQELLKDKAGTLRFTPYIDNRAAIASSATVVLKKPGGESLQASTAATVNGTTGEITYSLSSTLTATLDENYIAEWTYTVSGTVYTYASLFDVVLHKLAITVIDEDLINEQSDILELGEAFEGVVDSSTGSTLVDDDLKQFENDRFNNGRVDVINTANGARQIRTVTDFVSSTGTLTVTPDWGTNPDTTYSYVVRRSFKTKIEKAFNEIMEDIRARGNRPALIMESHDLHIVTVKKSLSMICKDQIATAEDKWHTLYKIYEGEYKDSMSKMVFQYDVDESGSIDGNDEKDQYPSLRFRR